MLDEIGGTLLDAAGDHVVRDLIESFVKPKFLSLKPKFSRDSKETELFSGQFENYLKRMYENSANLTTVILHQVPATIESLYVPLSIESSQKNPIEFVVKNEITKFIDQYKKIIITDSAGMGKSTIMKWMFRKSIEEGHTVPILIELRKLNKDNKIIDEIYKEINCINEEIDRELIMNLISTGGFTFFFDGYDEIILEEKNGIINDLQDFINKANKNKFLITSRHDASLTSFAGFYHFKVKPIELNQAYELIRKYATLDNATEIIDKLIDDINDEKNFSNLTPFLTNPLMVCLLYKGYEYKPKVPLKKHLFYRQVYDALFEKHDLSKGGAYSRSKECGLDIDTFHTIMRALAFITFIKNKVEYSSKDEILKFISDASKLSEVDVESALLLKDLTSTVPLFYEDGLTFRWAHKSLQEYFVASYFCVDASEKLGSVYDKEIINQYINVLDICYDMSYRIFKDQIMNKLILNFRDYLENEENKEFKWDRYLELHIYNFENGFEIFSDGEKFNEHTESLKRISKEVGREDYRSVSETSNSTLYIFFFGSEYYLMDLLFKKGKSFIKAHKAPIEEAKYIIDFENDYKFRNKLRTFLEDIDEDFRVKLEYDNEIWKNNKEMFDIALSIFITMDQTPVYYFDYNEMEALLEEIEDYNRLNAMIDL